LPSSVPTPSVPTEDSPTPTPESPLPAPTPEPSPKPAKSEDVFDPLEHSSAYIKFDGIDGEAQEAGHESWSQIVSFNQAIHQPGGGTDITRRRGEVVLDDIVVLKQIDKASPKLAEAITKGNVFPTVEIHFTGPSEGSTCVGTFYAYELKNVLITSYSVSGSNPLAFSLIIPAPDITMPSSGPFIVQAVDAPMEEIALNFEEIKVTYTECDASGSKQGNVEYSFKVEEGES
jgi:type VI secretion system secreted protein Hcp